MTTPRRLVDEECRILIAIEEDRFGVNKKTGRYTIKDEIPPDRRIRENLVKRGLFDLQWGEGRGTYWRLTTRGKYVLAAEMTTRGEEFAAKRDEMVANGMDFPDAHLKAAGLV